MTQREQDSNRERVITEFEAEHGRRPKFTEIRDYPGMNGVPAQREPVIPAPEQRVRAYLDALENSGLRTEIETLEGFTLDGTDIRDVVNELESWRARAEELGQRRDDARMALAPIAHMSALAREVIEVLSDEP